MASTPSTVLERARAAALRLPFDSLEEAPPDPTLWSEAPLELLVRFGCVPVGRAGGRLLLAFGDLEDPRKVDEVEFLLERPVDAVVAPAGVRRHTRVPRRESASSAPYGHR